MHFYLSTNNEIISLINLNIRRLLLTRYLKNHFTPEVDIWYCIKMLIKWLRQTLAVLFLLQNDFHDYLQYPRGAEPLVGIVNIREYLLNSVLYHGQSCFFILN